MYPALLYVHSYVRWLVIAAALWTLARAVSGVRGKRAWEPSDQRAGLLFVIAVDVQLLLGIGLWIASPFGDALRHSFHVAVKDAPSRFFGLEHPTMMLTAVIVAHVGRVLGKRKEGPARHRATLVTVGVFLFLVLANFPWPGLRWARPLLRTSM